MKCQCKDNDADRLLLFMAFVDPTWPRPTDTESLIKVFAKITGWDHSRAQSAFEVNVVKGFIDQK